MSFKKTILQRQAVKIMGGIPKFILLFGGSRCLSAETLVLTDFGYKRIIDIQPGERVPTLSNDNTIVSKTVVKKYINKGVHSRLKVITFVLNNNTQITCSHEHKLYFEGTYVKASIIAGRIMDRRNEQQRSLSCIKHGAARIYELLCFGQSIREHRDNESSQGRKWIFANNDKNKWQRENSQDAQIDCRTLDTKYTEEATSESHRSQQGKQLCSEFRVGYFQREYGSHDERGSSNREPWRKKWYAYINRKTGYSNTKRIYTIQSDTKNIGGKIPLYGKLYKRCNSGEKLEARELDRRDIKTIIFSETNEPLYDLQIEDNHNFFITHDNIISHNSGKTFIIIRQIILRALKEPNSRHLIVRFAFSHAKQSLWHDTIPKCLALCFPGVKPNMNNSDFFIEFPNGSQIWVGGLDDKDRTEKILGNEYCTIFYNEISQISWSSYATTVTRLAQKTGLVNKIYCDCNPPSKLHWSYKLFVEHKDPVSNEAVNPDLYAYLRLNPDDNKENLPDDYIESVLGTLSSRMQKRFRYGEFSDDIEGALWTYEMIDKNRVMKMPQLVRVVVGLDPSGSGKESADEAGIVVAGIDARGDGYVFCDKTAVLSPNQWGTEAIKAYYQWSANGIVAEVNQGWDMVEAVIRSIDKTIPVKKVVSKRGKALRADPIVALYEQGKIHHIGILSDLEDQMTTWDARESLVSPGRIDALVHALTELMLGSNWEFLVA